MQNTVMKSDGLEMIYLVYAMLINTQQVIDRTLEGYRTASVR